MNFYDVYCLQFSFCQCCRLLGEFVLPPSNNLPRTTREVFLIMKEIGMDYQAIDACPNDHIIYYGQCALENDCPQSEISTYRTNQVTKRVTHAILCYIVVGELEGFKLFIRHLFHTTPKVCKVDYFLLFLVLINL